MNENNLKLTNNFSEEINNYLSEVIIKKIKENNFDIFDKDFYLFNDLCKYVAFQNIDIPLKERRNILFLGNIKKEIICSDINCDSESIFINELIGECNCKINTFINNSVVKNEKKK